MVPDDPGVLVVGAGVIGSAVAYHLARRGLRVTVIDADHQPSLTTRASLGVLTHFNGGSNPLSRLYRDGLHSFPGLTRDLLEETGADIGWRRCGGLDLVIGDADESEARANLSYNEDRQCHAEWVDGHRLGDLEPTVVHQARAAVYYPDDQRVDPVRLRQALLQAAVQRGARLGLGEELAQLVRLDHETLMARTTTGSITARTIVLAAGAWTGALASQLGARLVLRPVRGQHLRFTAGPCPQCVLRHGGFHALGVEGDVVVGATVEDVGYAPEVTPAAAAGLFAARQIMLGAAARPTTQQVGLRPKPKGARPMVGPLREWPQVFVATGHYKNGVIMGPVTGELIAAWVDRGQAPWDLSYFAPER